MERFFHRMMPAENYIAQRTSPSCQRYLLLLEVEQKLRQKSSGVSSESGSGASQANLLHDQSLISGLERRRHRHTTAQTAVINLCFGHQSNG